MRAFDYFSGSFLPTRGGGCRGLVGRDKGVVSLFNR